MEPSTPSPIDPIAAAAAALLRPRPPPVAAAVGEIGRVDVQDDDDDDEGDEEGDEVHLDRSSLNARRIFVPREEAGAANAATSTAAVADEETEGEGEGEEGEEEEEEEEPEESGDLAFSPTHSRQSSRRFSRISYMSYDPSGGVGAGVGVGGSHVRNASITAMAGSGGIGVGVGLGLGSTASEEQEDEEEGGDMGGMMGDDGSEEDEDGMEVPATTAIGGDGVGRQVKVVGMGGNSAVAALKKRFEGGGESVGKGKGKEAGLPPAPESSSFQQATTHTSQIPSAPELKNLKGLRGNHQRIDSVPPQRYDLDEGETTAVPDTHHARYDSGDLIQHGAIPLASESAEYYEGPMDRNELQAPQSPVGGFEEVTLETQGGASSSRSPYGPGSHFARSSVEIRQDSIESGTRKARKAASSVGASDHSRVVLDLSRAESSSAALRRASASEIHRAARMQASDGSSECSTDVNSTRNSQEGQDQLRSRRRSAAGRYRGRRSEPPSRSGSPTTHFRSIEAFQPPIPSNLRTPRPEKEIVGAVSMVVAGEDGELQVVTAPTAVPPPAPISTEGVTPSEKKHFTPITPRETATESLTDAAKTNGTDLSDAADRPQKRNSKGSAAQDVKTSLTRMAHLPPKERKEETRHLRTFEEMMKQSKALERQREEDEVARKLQRDEELLDTTKRWNEEILPSWTRARKDPELRTLWWKGAPPSLRPRVWGLAVGNAQMLPRNLLQLASKAVTDSPGVIAPKDIEDLEADMQETLPSLKLYQRHTGPLWDDLHDVLVAFVMVRLDQLKERDDEPMRTMSPLRVYEMGAASLAGMLLTNLSPPETLVALINLIAERPWLQLLYSLKPAKAELAVLNKASFPPSQDDLTRAAEARAQVEASSHRAHERVFETLLADQMPKVYAILFQHGVRAAAFVTSWARRLFTHLLHFDTVARVWDVILLEEGDAVLFRLALALMHILEARLWVPDARELTSILVGNNRAALSVWHRALDGGGGSAGGVRREVALASLGSPTKGLAPELELEGAREAAEATEPNGTTSTTTTTTHDDEEGQPTKNGVSETPATTDDPQSDPHPISVRSPPSISTIEADPSLVPIDNIYAQYGITEDRLFRELEEQRTWWKDSTLERLMNRELGA